MNAAKNAMKLKKKVSDKIHWKAGRYRQKKCGTLLFSTNIGNFLILEVKK
jgi:hypothetical protein